MIPGTTIVFGVAAAHHFIFGSEHSASGWTIVWLAVLLVLSYAVEFFSGTMGAKAYGATMWGAIGGIVGGIVGLFFAPIGFIAGPLLGVLVGELLGGQGILPATKSTWGTLLGTAAGIFVKVGIAAVMVIWFLLSAFWR